MGKIERFEDIIAWQRAKELVLGGYGVFEGIRDYGFKGQIERAAVSIMNNIAEGFERQSNKEFKQFLYISKGSCAEVRSMLHLSKDLNFISEEQAEQLIASTEEISKMLSNFIKKL